MTRRLTPADVRYVRDHELPADALFERRFGRLGEREIRGGVDLVSDLPLDRAEWRAADATGLMTVRGHAAVFDRLSLDLGWFQEKIDAAAFDAVLASAPHVTLNYMHDDSYILGSTRAADANNGGLELRTDDVGLRFFSVVIHDPETKSIPSYAEDMRIGMLAGVIRQASFCFCVGEEEVFIDSEGNMTRTILTIDELFDVCVCPMGAYPQTDSEVVRGLVSEFAQARTAAGAGSNDHGGSDMGELLAAALEEAAAARQRTFEDADVRRRLARVHATTSRRYR